MNEEKNNIGVNNNINNSLPPMGVAPSNTNSVHDKYGLPPISNFTNFNNNYQSPVVDNNTSVFDLMDQFDSVNNNSYSNQNTEVNSNLSMQDTAANNIIQTENNTSFVNEVPNIPVVNIQKPQVQNQNISSIPQVNIGFSEATDNSTIVSNQVSLNGSANSHPSFNMFAGNKEMPGEVSLNTGLNSNAIEQNSNPSGFNVNNGNIQNQSVNSDPLSIFGSNIGVTDNNPSNLNTKESSVSLNNTLPSNNVSMNNSHEAITVNSVSNNVGIDQGVSVENNAPNVVVPSVSTPVNNMVEPNTLQVNDIVDKDLQEALTINPVPNNVGVNQGISVENSVSNVVVPNVSTPVNNMVESNTPQVNDIVDKDLQEVLTINPVSNNVGVNQGISVENSVPNVVVPNVSTPVNNMVESNTPQVNDIVDKDLQEALTINSVSNNAAINQGITVENNVPNVVVPNVNIPVSNSAESSIPQENTVGYNNISAPVINSQNSIDNNIPNFNFNNFNVPVSDIGETSGVIEIPTVSMDSVLGDNNNNTINNTSDGVDELITNFVGDNTEGVNNSIDANITNNTNAGTNTETLVTENAKPKKKKKKALFIILLIITILIVAAVGVLSYFMFFKADKLVCGNQDYSQPQYMLDESMVMNFKGNTLTNTNLNQRITFNNDYLDKKDAYLEELKNQYQGLGFNVSFVENEDGFDISMNFTKKELESWYGTSLKNSSKSQMKKEMRESGYTCK